MFDRDMRYLAASGRWREAFGLESRNLVGRTHQELLPDWPLPWPEHHRKCLAGIPVSREDSLLRPDGELDWLRWSMAPWHDGHGEVGGTVMFAEVITGRKRAAEEERRLMGERASRGRIADILESISDAFFAVDRDWRFTFVNRAAERVLLRSQQDLIGRQVWSEFPEAAAHPIREALARAFDDQVPMATEEFYPPAGRWFEVRAYPSRDALSIYFRDITKRRQAAETEARLLESLRRSEQMSALGSLVAGVAHQVRNPLFGITLALHGLQKKLEDRADLARFFATLEEQVTRLNAVMQDLLDYGKPAPPDNRPGSVTDAIEGAASSLRPHAEAARVSLVLELAELPPVLMDRQRLPHVFQNLIDNAIQHSPPGGVVRISARETSHQAERRICCEIADQGPGFPPDDVTRVFQPFYSRREGGTGLGLAIVQRIVEEHGGRVWAANHPGGGLVTVELPRMES